MAALEKKKKKNVLGWNEKCFRLKQKRFGLKKVFLGWKAEKRLGWKKGILGWKIKGNTPKEKKRGLEKSVGHWSRKESYSFLTVLTNSGYSFLSIFFSFFFGRTGYELLIGLNNLAQIIEILMTYWRLRATQLQGRLHSHISHDMTKSSTLQL